MVSPKLDIWFRMDTSKLGIRFRMVSPKLDIWFRMDTSKLGIRFHMAPSYVSDSICSHQVCSIGVFVPLLECKKSNKTLFQIECFGTLNSCTWIIFLRELEKPFLSLLVDCSIIQLVLKSYSLCQQEKSRNILNILQLSGLGSIN